jgi:protein TonB
VVDSGRINWMVMACSVAGHVALAGVLAGAVLLRPVAPRTPPGDTLTFRLLPAPAASVMPPAPAPAARVDRAPTPRVAAVMRGPTVPMPAALPGGVPAAHQAHRAAARTAPAGLDEGDSAPTARAEAATPGAHLRYQQLLHDLIARQARYPDAARAAHAAGLTRLGFRIDRLGHVVDSWVQGSSGVAALDGAAEAALRRADPLPPVPPALPAPIAFVIEFDAAGAAALR